MDVIVLPSYIALWLFSLFQCVLLLVLARQVGRILLRVEPSAGAAVTNDGPRIGDILSITSIQDIADRLIPIASATQDTLLIFTTPGCTSCKSVYPAVKALPSLPDLRVVVISGADSPDNDDIGKDLEGHGIPYIVAPTLPRLLNLTSPPYAIMIDTERRVITKGVVNHLLHLESLVNARRHGVATAEEFQARHIQLHHSHELSERSAS